ncbi:MAG TPA: hypothetical protein VGX91_11515 [Candidatus Cybelea sp.]|jgi:hypothetical protein|nr:hypothetical protein [Candidatus Cybelea sp.]
MKRLSLGKYALNGGVAALLLAGCGGSQPIAAPVATSSATLAGYPTIAPDKHAKAKIFEYVANATDIGIFDYPKSDRQIGSFDAAGGQECTNVLYGSGKEIFWVVAGEAQITEYQLPKKAIETLSDSVGPPSSCAMDNTGDLAVGILTNGDIDIFRHAKGSGTVMSSTLAKEYFDGYDNKGNLFADGFSNGSGFELVELPKGSGTFETITTSNTVQFPGSVQWDGKYLTVADQSASALYRYTVKGTTATLMGTISLTGAGDCAQTWIAKSILYCADAGNAATEVFNYPAGGSPIAILAGNSNAPLGVVAVEK